MPEEECKAKDLPNERPTSCVGYNEPTYLCPGKIDGSLHAEYHVTEGCGSLPCDYLKGRMLR